MTLTINTSTLGTPGPQKGVAFRRYIDVQGGPYTLAVTKGTLPAGLRIDGSSIVGTPETGGPYEPFELTATATMVETVSKMIGMATTPPVVTPPVVTPPVVTPPVVVPPVVTPPVVVVPPTTGGGKGPSGLHWPIKTLRPDAQFDRVIDVECTWAAIGAAITAAAGIDRVKIRVAPGTLPGNGSGSGAPPVLANVGNASRTTRILIVPRDGVFSIKHSASFRIHNVAGVSFMGFTPQGLGQTGGEGHAVILTDTKNFAWGWSKTNSVNMTAYATIADTQLVEAVAPNQRIQDNADRHRYATLGNGRFDGVMEDGCYWAPSSVSAGSNYHNDCLQMEGVSRQFHGFIFRDTAFFHHVDQTIMINSPQAVRFENVAILGGGTSTNRYPRPAGIKATTASGAPWSINGSAPITVIDSMLAGAIKGGGASGINSVSTHGGKGFRTDPTLFNTAAKIDAALGAFPTDERLKAYWKALG